MGPDNVETTPRSTQMDYLGYDAETIKMPDEGINPDALEAQLELHKFSVVHRVSIRHKHLLIL
jgi:hypothetical protein